MSAYKKSIDVKNRILNAAEELFALNGFDATGIAQIAEKTQITKSLLYYYFDSKDQILEELVSNYLLKIKEEKKKILSSGLSQAEAVEQSMLKGFSLLSGNKKLIRILIAEMLKGKVKSDYLLNIIESIMPAALSGKVSFKKELSKSSDLSTYMFFFALSPIISYMIFGETWISNKQLDETDFAKQFVGMAISSLCNDYTGVTRDFFETHYEIIVENIKKLL
jgi:AcrR family transcriptional regulator